MKIFAYLALLAVFSGDQLFAHCNTRSSQKTRAQVLPAPSTNANLNSNLNVGTGGIKFSPVAQIRANTPTPVATPYYPIGGGSSTGAVSTEDELPELAPAQLSLFSKVTSILGKVPTETTP